MIDKLQLGRVVSVSRDTNTVNIFTNKTGTIPIVFDIANGGQSLPAVNQYVLFIRHSDPKTGSGYFDKIIATFEANPRLRRATTDAMFEGDKMLQGKGGGYVLSDLVGNMSIVDGHMLNSIRLDNQKQQAVIEAIDTLFTTFGVLNVRMLLDGTFSIERQNENDKTETLASFIIDKDTNLEFINAGTILSMSQTGAIELSQHPIGDVDITLAKLAIDEQSNIELVNRSTRITTSAEDGSIQMIKHNTDDEETELAKLQIDADNKLEFTNDKSILSADDTGNITLENEFGSSINIIEPDVVADEEAINGTITIEHPANTELKIVEDGTFTVKTGINPDDPEDVTTLNKFEINTTGNTISIIDKNENKVILNSETNLITIAGKVTDGKSNKITIDSVDNIITVTDSNDNTIVISDGKITLTASSEINFNGGTEGVARKNDQVKSTSSEDSSFWTFFTQLMAFLNTHTHPTTAPGAPTLPPLPGPTFSAPSSVTGKIIQASGTVKAGD